MQHSWFLSSFLKSSCSSCMEFICLTICSACRWQCSTILGTAGVCLLGWSPVNLLKVYSRLPFFWFVTLSRDLDQRHRGSSISHTVCLSSSWNLISVDCLSMVAIAVTRDMCKQGKWWCPLLRIALLTESSFTSGIATKIIYGFCQALQSSFMALVWAAPSTLHVVVDSQQFLELWLHNYPCDHRSAFPKCIVDYHLFALFCFPGTSWPKTSKLQYLTYCLSKLNVKFDWCWLFKCGSNCSCKSHVQTRWLMVSSVRDCTLDCISCHLCHNHKDHTWN